MGSSSQLARQRDDSQDSYVRKGKIEIATTNSAFTACVRAHRVHSARMKARLLMIAAFGLLLAACNHPESTAKTDLDRFQGAWDLVSATQGGQALPQDKVKQTTIVFKGDTFRFLGLAEYATSREGTVKLDETKSPKEMDAISTDKEVMLGIYVLQEKGYKVCFAPAGKPRPTEFTSTPENGYILQSWERVTK